MNSITIPMTAQTPSRFGMPIYGSAFGITPACTAGYAAVAPVVRDRRVAGASLVKGTFPGTTAWSPPTC